MAGSKNLRRIPALEIRNASYAVNGKKILDSINWTVERGEHWAVLGPNGSGKTTLLRIACGYLWPNAGGEVLRNGQELVNLRDLRRRMMFLEWKKNRLAFLGYLKFKIIRLFKSEIGFRKT